MMRQAVIYKSYIGLILYALIVGLCATFLAETLKYITAVAEEGFLEILQDWPILYLIFPGDRD